ncbi:hypothetical protein Tco_0607406, partial [Tanacetum coccineum]
NREGNRRGRNAAGIRPSEIEAREGENKGVNLPPTFGGSLGKKQKQSTPTIIFNLRTGRPLAFD